MFFLILGANLKYEEFKELTNDAYENKGKSLNIINFNTNNSKSLDSITKVSKDKIDKDLKNFGVDSITRNKIKKNIDASSNNDTLKKSRKNVDLNKLERIYSFQKKNPNMGINESLDSLKIEKSFTNRFLYRKINVINSFSEDVDKANRELTNELISYASISIFIFLPLFTLFLKLLYFRRNFTYVEHLIFVFHSQTVFFILLILFFILNIWMLEENILFIFSILFLIYLFLAMKRFYKQGFFKTLIKFIILNSIYFFLASIGFFLVALLAFAFY